MADEVKPGLSTSEGKLAVVTAALSVAAAIVPPVWTALSDIAAQYPQVRWLAGAVSVVGILGTVLTSMGYSKARSAVKSAASTAAKMAPILLLFGLGGCAALGGSSGSTGKVQLSDKVSCTTTLGVRDPATCAQSISVACDVPEIKAADGGCTLLGLNTGSISLGKGVSTSVSVAQSPTPCMAIVTSSWVVPSGKLVDGTCQ